jgi:RNA polymerase sigma factor (sigma-70 family)
LKVNSEIVILFKKGEDQKALNLLYKTVLPKVKRYVTNNGGDLAESEDIFQDAVMILYKLIKSNKFQPEQSVDAYLFTIAKNHWINKAKRDSKIKRVEELPETNRESENIYSLLISDERQKVIENILSQLGEKCHKILKMIFFEGYSLPEITKEMNFASDDVMHTTHYRCKNKLKGLVGENLEFRNMLQKL